MKRVLIRLAVASVLLVMGFVSGRVYQDFRTGYHYKVLEHKEFPSALGSVQWSCVTESVGHPLFDTGTTIIKLDNRTIYKAQRDFQESAPYAENIETTNESISWDDVDFRYHLTVEPTPKSPLGRAKTK